jgi:hypothetical protein
MKATDILRKKRRYFFAWFIGISLILLVACGTRNQQTEEQSGVPQVATAFPSPTVSMPPWLATRSADETRIALAIDQYRTAVALTPRPSTRTLPPPMPTPTWELGWIGCTNGNSLQPERYSCWRGVINNEIISIAAGQQSYYSDRSQGLLMIFHGGVFDINISSTEIYSTPLKLGGVRIASLDLQDMLISLTPYDPRTPGPTATPGTIFTFNLITHQWITPTPGPTTTAVVTITPVSSVSPLPTQLTPISTNDSTP